MRSFELPTKAPFSNDIVDAYFFAKYQVIAAGYGSEIDHHRQASLEKISETDFLQEAAWVVLSSGMREIVVRRKFAEISAAFLEWKSANAIIQLKRTCRAAALVCFSHPGKIDAILDIAEHVDRNGFNHVKQSIQTVGLEYLETFAFIGPVTR